ncbi:MAG: ABC transporter permease [Saprospiraceae bacterium]|nr:ABC transporter permease [Saprospiraceae bacterium]MCB9327240.1 ABC transporter permease [Lewinellaceae bacterium]
MNSVLKYSFYEMIRSRWLFIYTGFYLLVSVALIMLSGDSTKVLISLSNITLGITPMVGILFGTNYYYNSREFIQLLLCQPISRWKIFSAFYMGLAIALCLSIIVGIGLPLTFMGIFKSGNVSLFFILIAMACMLSIIFSLLAFLIAVKFDNKVKGLSIAVLLWLFFAIIYDGLVLLTLLVLKDYPLDKLTISLMLANPIDLARILILLKLDISAMMGYTGAVLSKFIGKSLGSLLIALSLLLWTLIPMGILRKILNSKDF